MFPSPGYRELGDALLATGEQGGRARGLPSAQRLVVISPSAKITSPRPTTIHQTVWVASGRWW